MAWLWDKKIKYRDKNGINEVPLVANKDDIEQTGKLVPVIAKDGTKVYAPFTDEMVAVEVSVSTRYTNKLTAPFNFKATLDIYIDKVSIYSKKGVCVLDDNIITTNFITVFIDFVFWYNNKGNFEKTFGEYFSNSCNSQISVATGGTVEYAGINSSVGKMYTDCRIGLPNGKSTTLFRITNGGSKTGTAYISSKELEKFLDYNSYLLNLITPLKLRRSVNCICNSLLPAITINYTTTEKRRTESGNYTITYYDGFEVKINSIKSNVKLPANCYFFIRVGYSYTQSGPYGSDSDGSNQEKITLNAGSFSCGGNSVSTDYNVTSASITMKTDTYKGRSFGDSYRFNLRSDSGNLTFKLL